MDVNLTELHDDGWLVNQCRMWLSSQWTVRAGARWRDGDDAFFTHLLDGSRAANRLGWQWTVGVGHRQGLRVLALAGAEAGAEALRASAC